MRILKRKRKKESFIDNFMVLVTWFLGIIAGVYAILGASKILPNPTALKLPGIELTTTSIALVVSIFCISISFFKRYRDKKLLLDRKAVYIIVIGVAVSTIALGVSFYSSYFELGVNENVGTKISGSPTVTRSVLPSVSLSPSFSYTLALPKVLACSNNPIRITLTSIAVDKEKQLMTWVNHVSYPTGSKAQFIITDYKLYEGVPQAPLRATIHQVGSDVFAVFPNLPKISVTYRLFVSAQYNTMTPSGTYSLNPTQVVCSPVEIQFLQK